MALSAAYLNPRRAEELARLRRILALEGMAAAGKSQRQIAEPLGITQPAVFGSVARDEARQDSIIDLLVEAPEGTASSEFDDDIRREAVLL